MLLGLGVVTLAGMLFGTAPAYAGTPAGACEANVTTVGRYCEVGRDPGCTCLFESGSFGCAYISEDVLSRHVYVYFPTNDSEPVDGRADVPTYFRARLIRRNGSVAVLGRRHYTSDWVRWWVQNPADLSWHQQNTGVHGLYNDLGPWLMQTFNVGPGEYWLQLGYSLYPDGPFTWSWANMAGSGIIGYEDGNGGTTYEDHCSFEY